MPYKPVVVPHQEYFKLEESCHQRQILTQRCAGKASCRKVFANSPVSYVGKYRNTLNTHRNRSGKEGLYQYQRLSWEAERTFHDKTGVERPNCTTTFLAVLKNRTLKHMRHWGSPLGEGELWVSGDHVILSTCHSWTGFVVFVVVVVVAFIYPSDLYQ